MPFNQKMFQGNLSKKEYLNYLVQQFAVFGELEKTPLPHDSLSRSKGLIFDIQELLNEGLNMPSVLPATKAYVDYLAQLAQEQRLAHVYLQYLAVVFGGQMMKTKVPSSGKFYAFDSISEGVQAIRNVQKDEWADEVNVGFDFTIEIFRELEWSTNDAENEFFSLKL